MIEQTSWETGTARAAASAMGAVACIWAAVVAISVFSPDLVSGSEQEHLPVAAFGTWLWGAVATKSVVTALLRMDRAGGASPLARQLTGAVGAVWTVAAVVSIFGPQMVTGSDPTQLPIAALVAPVAATVLTAGVCEIFGAFAAPRGDRVS